MKFNIFENLSYINIFYTMVKIFIISLKKLKYSEKKFK